MMEAAHIQAKDLRGTQRVNLAEAIPLAIPFVVYVEPTNRCNFRCKFCPTSDHALLKSVGREMGDMTMSTFRQVVDDVADMGRIKTLNLYLNGEPLVNPHFTEMVQYAKSADIADCLYMRTNGSLLTRGVSEGLVDAGIDIIGVSVEAVSAEGYEALAGVSGRWYERVKANVAALYEVRGNAEVYVKIIDAGLSDEERDRFYTDFGPISTKIAVEGVMGWSRSDAKDFTLGVDSDTCTGWPLKGRTVCPNPFYTLTVNFDGTVSVCCVDWSYATVVGDIRDESLSDIWNGERMRAFQMMQLTGRRAENPACAACDCIRVGPDVLDDDADAIIARLT
jgi:radical SAM protein with 4Fe4S-binding SPASM domain